MKFRNLPIIVWAIVLMTVVFDQPARADEAPHAFQNVGVRQIAAPSKERGINLDVTVWYPAQAGGKPITLGASPFFEGTDASRDAPISAGSFPIVLLSHGIGLAGYAEALSWIATPLAKAGFVVAAPSHPGSGGPERSAAEAIKLWKRPQDLSNTLNAIGRNAVFKPHLQLNEVGVLGLSAGGSTALEIAGARIDPTRLAGYCDTERLNASLCQWLRQSGVDLHALDRQAAGRESEDKRVRFAMAIDPAPVDVLDLRSFRGISIPVTVVNLGRPGQIPVTTDASEIAKMIPHATYSTIADASHFSMFGVCKPGAAKRAERDEIGDPICADGGGRPRHAIHRQLIDMAIAAFTRALKPSS
ncbi:alpha/beta hydrolase family protein [Jiella mangrovi]|uniref:Dienelactone hydrolase n=1 Tax=Jiella mangrovi TaxID=2821407 RepID=A0ABS4BJZ4_9HYPH|nr:alpha/beta fold hydrolase [Jiella mangrovi]MBP0617026.1 dienelactone hydrolase [Jiella mangrovi]